MKFLDFQNGKKTYAVVVIGIGLGIAQHFGWTVPAWVDWGLTFLGLGTLRHAVQSQSAKSADDVAETHRSLHERRYDDGRRHARRVGER